MAAEYNALQYFRGHLGCIVTALYALPCLIESTHTEANPGLAGYFSHQICVATEVIAAWDARFDDLLFPTLRGAEAGKSPMVTQPRCPLSPYLDEESGVSIYSMDIFMFGGSHVFLSTHVHTVP